MHMGIMILRGIGLLNIEKSFYRWKKGGEKYEKINFSNYGIYICSAGSSAFIRSWNGWAWGIQRTRRNQ